MINYWNKKIKNMDAWDIGLIKLSVAVAVLFIITIWPAAMDWVHSVNPWYFLVAFVIFVARPFYRVYLK
ncbi:hypothetical protein ACFL0X_02115 [Nanoarchaeota archaeon]